MGKLGRFIGLFAVAMVAIGASAQNLPSPAYSGHGAYELFSFGTSHDSAVGWTSEMDSGLGYDFNKTFSMETGVPLYFVGATTTQTQSGTTTSTTDHYNSIGDAYVGLNLHPKLQAFGFATGLVGTAPTGNRTNGISTGRPTVNWNNRLEKDFGHLTPFAEATLGNSLASTKRFRRPFTTLGAVSTFTGGTSIDLFKSVSIEASAYDVAPFGDQKIYSHNGKQVDPTKTRSFQKAAVTAGSASIAKDHGFSGVLSFNPTQRVGVDFAYTRSIGFDLDSIGATISFRLGHLATPPAKKN
jgi:hypothetical protein